MKRSITIVCLLFAFNIQCRAQENDLFKAGDHFVRLLDNKQREQAVYPYDSAERYTWGYVPKTDRKGISLNEMNEQQKAAAIQLMKITLSENAYKKAIAIMSLEKVLKVLENRPEADHYRDGGKYYFTVFGEPSATGIWGWRLDGHHLSFSFSSASNKLVSGTPGFLGANPAVVLSGPEKGLEILKEETVVALEFLHSLTALQLSQTIVDSIAPADILTTASRKAVIENPRGLAYTQMTQKQQAMFMQLLSIYIHRYTHFFAANMMNDIENAGLGKLLFCWAGSSINGVGHPKYYRIQGPTILIEYDNTQNNGNHVHSVVRDLKNDFGGDELMEHYKRSHNNAAGY